MYEPETIENSDVRDANAEDFYDRGIDGNSAHDVEKGAVLGIAGGAVIGAFAGGPIGAVIGAVAGGALSAGAVAGVDTIDNDGSIGELQDTHHDGGFPPPNTAVVGPYDEPVTAPLSDPFATPPAYVGPPNGSGVYPNVVPVNYDNSTPDEDSDEDDAYEEADEDDAIGAETDEPADETDTDDPDSGLRSLAYP